MDPLDILSGYLVNGKGSNCGTGAGGFKKSNTCAVGSGKGDKGGGGKSADTIYKVGDVVEVIGGNYKGKVGTVTQGLDQFGEIKVRMPGHHAFIKPGNVKAASDARVEKVSGLTTKYSLKQLADASKKAGKSLFGRQLEYTRPTEVEHVNLSDLRKKSRSGEGKIDDWEYIFKPSTGEGMDLSGASWKDATKGWTDKDGNIYTHYEDTVRVCGCSPERGPQGRGQAPVLVAMWYGVDLKETIMAIEPEVIEGPTPNGGVRSIAYWFDADGNPVEKDKATNVEIHEIGKDGEIIHRIYGGVGEDGGSDDTEE